MRGPGSLLGLLFLLSLPVWARVGGGQSYSGGGSGHSGGSDGGGGEAIGFIFELLFRLIFYYPKIGIPLVIALVVGYFYFKRTGQAGEQFRDLQNWSADHAVQRRRPPSLDDLRDRDPDFSETLFLDFVTSLYSRLVLNLGQDLSDIGAYLGDSVRSRLETDEVTLIEAVIIGSVRLLSITQQSDSETVDIEVESNLFLQNGDELYVVDRMVLKRAPGTRTNPPKTVYSVLPQLWEHLGRRQVGALLFLPAGGEHGEVGLGSQRLHPREIHSQAPRGAITERSGDRDRPADRT